MSECTEKCDVDLSEKGLDAIEQRASKATAGPWVVVPCGCGCAARRVRFQDGEDASVLFESDAAFIAAARTDVPAFVAEVRRLRTRDARIPSLDQLDALLAKYRAQSHGEPIDLLGAIQTAEARAEAAREHAHDPNARRHLLLDCAAWALAAVCEIDGAQASAPVAVTREANDEGGGP